MILSHTFEWCSIGFTIPKPPQISEVRCNRIELFKILCGPWHPRLVDEGQSYAALTQRFNELRDKPAFVSDFDCELLVLGERLQEGHESSEKVIYSNKCLAIEIANVTAETLYEAVALGMPYTGLGLCPSALLRYRNGARWCQAAFKFPYGEFKHKRHLVHASLPPDNGQSMHTQLGSELLLCEAEACPDLLQLGWFHSRLPWHCCRIPSRLVHQLAVRDQSRVLEHYILCCEATFVLN
jgi:hypothetical protein